MSIENNNCFIEAAKLAKQSRAANRDGRVLDISRKGLEGHSIAVETYYGKIRVADVNYPRFFELRDASKADLVGLAQAALRAIGMPGEVTKAEWENRPDRPS
jgi:hypothetical protein